MKKQFLKETLFVSALLAISGVLLTVIQEPFNLWFLAWFAYVPFIIAALREEKTGRLIIISYIIGLLYWLVNLHYVIPVTVWGWAAFCAYTALLFPLLIYTLRTLFEKYNIPLFLLFAIVLTGMERLQGFLLGGFAWRMLGHSQYENIRLIQIADVLGAGGVTFLVAMANGQIAEIINEFTNRKNKSSPSPVRVYVYSVFVIFAVTASLVYGTFRIEQYRETSKPGPEVAAVQSNIPQSVKKSFSAERQILTQLLKHSRKAQESNPLLIVWPETMVQAVLNRQLLSLISDSHLYCEFDKILRKHAKGNSYLLIGAMGGTPQIRENGEIILEKKYNSAYLYTPDGGRTPTRYDKIHLVPFGEFIPFRESCPPIYKFFMSFSPYDYDYSLNAGDEYTLFNIKDTENEQNYKFGVMICYEDTVPEIASRFTLNEKGNKQADWLVNISNDGWFVKFRNGETIPTGELNQHTVICAFRAVENRVGIIRSVNTGISCVIDPLGRIKYGYKTGNLPRNPMERRGIAGWFSDNLPIDKRVTIFSRYGRWLDNLSAVFLTAGFIWSLILKKKKKKKR